VADCFKFRSKVGTELAIQALREDAGDRIQIGESSGDVIDIGFFYTRAEIERPTG
jgi:hypothetical protein